MMKTKYFIASFLLVIFGSFIAQAQLVGPIVALTGNVFNAVTKQPVTVFLMVFDTDGKRINATRSNAADNGYFYITGLKPGIKYKVTVKQKFYFNEEFEITIPNTDKYLEISHDFLVKPMEKDARLRFPVSPFELNKSKLRYGSEFLLDEFVSTLKNNPEVKFTIACFPDNNDNDSENMRLTEERTQSLKTYFETNGIEASRITIKGSAKTDPQNPPPSRKSAKGKRYIGSSYIVVNSF